MATTANIFNSLLVDIDQNMAGEFPLAPSWVITNRGGRFPIHEAQVRGKYTYFRPRYHPETGDLIAHTSRIRTEYIQLFGFFYHYNLRLAQDVNIDYTLVEPLSPRIRSRSDVEDEEGDGGDEQEQPPRNRQRVSSPSRSGGQSSSGGSVGEEIQTSGSEDEVPDGDNEASDGDGDGREGAAVPTGFQAFAGDHLVSGSAVLASNSDNDADVSNNAETSSGSNNNSSGRNRGANGVVAAADQVILNTFNSSSGDDAYVNLRNALPIVPHVSHRVNDVANGVNGTIAALVMENGNRHEARRSRRLAGLVPEYLNGYIPRRRRRR
jgi:hypothetical protein